MATDFAFKFGCGRYLQGAGVVSMVGEEVLRLHARRPLIIGGPTALSLAEGKIRDSLGKVGLFADTLVHDSWCCPAYVHNAVLFVNAHGSDIIIGVGGGKIMDFCKEVAATASLPILNIPTSAATCAAFTPLSVMYTEAGAVIQGSHKHKHEVNGVIVDLDLMLTQPPRLLIAGVYDALAKCIETNHRIHGKSEDDIPLGLDFSYLLAKETYTQLLHLLPKALEALKTKTVNRAFERLIYINIAVTGMISGIAKGSGQSAIAHEFYELVRTYFTEQAKDFVHGELVGMGLAAQLYYNGDEDKIEELRDILRTYGLPVYYSDIGVEPSEANIRLLYDEIMQSGSMEDETPDRAARLYPALCTLIGNQ